MGRYKTLAGNTLIFGISNFSSKLLVFFMLPIYTSYLSTAEYGTVDLVTTAVSLLIPILTMCISGGVMRFSLDREYDNKKVFSVGVRVILLSILVFIVISPVFLLMDAVKPYYVFCILLYLVNVANEFLNNFARGIQEVKLVGIAGVSATFVAVVTNIIFLVVFRWGIKGYIGSLIISQFVSANILFFGGRIYSYFSHDFDKSIARDVLQYSAPMVPNKLSWWVNHFINRYILNGFLGTSEVGLYSVATKMPQIIDTFRGIFVEAWQLSMITEYEDDESKGFFVNVYRVYSVFLILLTAVLILSSKWIASFLYAKDFFEAWVFTPMLLVSTLFGSLIAFYSPIYLAYKKTNKLFLFTLAGAVVTVIANLLLVPVLKVNGAVVSSVLSNLIICLSMSVDSRRYLKMEVSKWRFYISYILLTVIACMISFCRMSPINVLNLSIIGIILILNAKSIKIFFEQLYTVVLSKLNRKKV